LGASPLPGALAKAKRSASRSLAGESEPLPPPPVRPAVQLGGRVLGPTDREETLGHHVETNDILMLKNFLQQAFDAALSRNDSNIVRFARQRVGAVEGARVCDLGSGDGVRTQALSSALRDASIDCIEIHPPYIAEAQRRGFTVRSFDLNGPFDVETAAYDLIVANQVIEHLYDTDGFLAEIYRALKPGGHAIVSTENAASWHNVVALALGWQPFSLTNISALSGAVGNPLSLHGGEASCPFPLQHHRVVALRALVQLFELHGFVEIAAAGSGYYPLPSWIGGIDPWHAHFITVAARKPS
jgi:SAM-dependent methyltransferase